MVANKKFIPFNEHNLIKSNQNSNNPTQHYFESLDTQFNSTIYFCTKLILVPI